MGWFPGRHTTACPAARQAALILLLGCLSFCQSASADDDDDDFRVIDDPPSDAVPRRTDPGGNAVLGPETRLPELLTITIGGWEPNQPAVDVFTGEFEDSDLRFFRMDIELAGLVNPPGPTNTCTHDPYLYGPSPIYGFIEVDVDDDRDTGGETDAPQFRYLSNVARFGGLPAEQTLRERSALGGDDIDFSFTSFPQIERSGEEYHLDLLGCLFIPGDIDVRVGDGDLLFEAGETWHITASWFHRAHGFEPFSFADGGAVAGEYAPESVLAFEHDIFNDITTISLVFPLTNAGSAAVREEAEQPNNADPSDQGSVLEGLEDLVESSEFFGGVGPPEFALIDGWAGRSAEDFLDPLSWEITSLLGTISAASELGGPYFIWTDIYPNVLRGDFDGNESIDEADTDALNQFIVQRDSDDGMLDSTVELAFFAQNFSVFDLFADGRVDIFDLGVYGPTGDTNFDGEVDLLDFAVLQNCFAGPDRVFEVAPCVFVDIDRDEDVDFFDLTFVLTAIDQ